MVISTTITLTTTLSMSAICTNGIIKSGGAYYIISRTIGPAFGGAVGVLLSFGNMLAIALYLIGFGETLVENLDNDNDFNITKSTINDIRIWANILLILVLCLAIGGLKYVIKTQLALLVFICFTIFTLILGSFYQTSPGKLYGYNGYINGNFFDNLYPKYTDGYNFFSVLAIYFPAVTGIMAGANISGDLRNPSSDIPKGTLTAIIVSTIVYMILAIIVGTVADREELVNNNLVMLDICVWSYIVSIGIYAATLSSAIASLVGAPRILMAVADDDILNIYGLKFFAKTDKNMNPIRGYFLSFVAAFAFNCIGDLNTIAPLISQFFIIVYLLINFSCFIMETSRHPGWRPTFKYFNRYTCLFGTIICIVIMFLLDHWYAIGTLFIAFILYSYITISDPDVSWGGSWYSYSVYKVYRNLLNLALKDHKSNNSIIWRPSFLSIKFDQDDDQLINFVETLRKDHSLIFTVSIKIGDYRNNLLMNNDNDNNNRTNANNENNGNKKGLKIRRQRSISGYLPIKEYQQKRTKLKGKRVLGFNNVITSDSYRHGLQSTLQLCGLGALKPNIVILNLLKQQEHDNEQEMIEYVECLRDILLTEMGLILCCGLCEKIDFSLKTYGAGILDVWLMTDDGGLTLLLPYIMILCTFYDKLKVRINIVTDNDNTQATNIKELIHKFRLPYDSNPRIIYVKNNKPSDITISKFENLSNCKIQEMKRKNVISRWLKLSELIQENTDNEESKLLIVTCPIPTNFINPIEYMSLLYMLSNQKALPPMILIRGNGHKIISFESE